MDNNVLPLDEVENRLHKFGASVNLVHVVQQTIDELVEAENLILVAKQNNDEEMLKEYENKSKSIMRTLANLSTAAEITLGIYA